VEAGEAGGGGEAGGRAGEGWGGARPEVEDGPDRWAPPVGERRERRWEAGAIVGLCGPKVDGPAVGWVDRFVVFSLSFSNQFQTNFSNHF
jgi:hypothetical protein